MRITQNITYNTYINDLMRKQESLYNLNLELSTGKKVNAPSDDPVAASKILSSRSVLSSFDIYEKNIDSGLEYLNVSEKTLSNVKDVLSKMQELAVSESSTLADAGTRSNSANVASSLFDQLVSLGNTTDQNSQYIFSGYKADTQPFDSAGAFMGDANKKTVKINPSSTITLGVNGSEVFKGSAGGTDIYKAASDFVTALKNNDTAGINAAIKTLDTSFNQVSEFQSDVGGRITRLQSSKNDISNARLDVKSTVSNLEDADVTKVISDLQLGQVALNAAMTSAGKVFSVNIFNYL